MSDGTDLQDHTVFVAATVFLVEEASDLNNSGYLRWTTVRMLSGMWMGHDAWVPGTDLPMARICCHTLVRQHDQLIH